MGGILSVNNVKKRFGNNAVLEDISFSLDQGKIYQIIGPNGSGKTTLINIISGLLRPDSGKIEFCDTDITQKSMQQIFKIGMVRTWQTPQPFVNLDTLENIAIADSENPGESFVNAPFKKVWKKKESDIVAVATDIMRDINLYEKKDIQSQNLSGGQQKLLELGRAMMSGARLILMDEPIAGVNPTLAKQIFEKISHIAKNQNVTFLIIEHRLDISLPHADHIFAIHQGKIVAQGDYKTVIKDPKVVSSYLQ